MTQKFFTAISLVAFAGTALAQDKSKALLFQPGANIPESARVEVNPASIKLDSAISKMIDAFFAALEQRQIDQAYEQLTKDTKIAEKPENVVTLKSKTQQAIDMFGEIRGAERIAVQNVGTHLLSATYLSIGKNFPLRWRFYFYRADETWHLIDIRVDDRLMDMFGEPAAESTPTQWPR